MRRIFGMMVTLLLVFLVSACGSAAPSASSTAAATTGAVTGSTSAATTDSTSVATTSSTSDATTSSTSVATVEGTSATTEATSGMMATSGATTGATTDAMTSATSGMMATTGATTDATTSATSGMMATTGATTDATTSATSGMMATTGTVTGTSVTTGTVSGTPTASDNLVNAIAANPDLATLATAIQASGIGSTLQGVGPFTIFAPSDEAFAALPQSTLTALLANPTQLASILSYHVTQGSLKAADIAKVTSVNTVEGQPITISASGGTVTLNGQAKVTTADIVTSNGVIHIIDKVLIPSDVTVPTS